MLFKLKESCLAVSVFLYFICIFKHLTRKKRQAEYSFILLSSGMFVHKTDDRMQAASPHTAECIKQKREDTFPRSVAGETVMDKHGQINYVISKRIYTVKEI